jgi:hypothetical protein
MKLELKMLTSSVNQTSDENIPDVYQILLQNQLLMQNVLYIFYNPTIKYIPVIEYSINII